MEIDWFTSAGIWRRIYRFVYSYSEQKFEEFKYQKISFTKNPQKRGLLNHQYIPF